MRLSVRETPAGEAFPGEAFAVADFTAGIAGGALLQTRVGVAGGCAVSGLEVGVDFFCGVGVGFAAALSGGVGGDDGRELTAAGIAS